MIRAFPSVSSGDSIDWKEPTPDDITERVVNGVKSGSILLFHNDLENTTTALPEVLSQLRDKGYEFITVSDLIYHENYTIDPEGMQVPDVLSNLDITADNVDEVMAQYAEEIEAAGFSQDQVEQVAEAIRNGVELPDEVMAVIADLGIEIPVSVDGVIGAADTATEGQRASDNKAAQQETINNVTDEVK